MNYVQATIQFTSELIKNDSVLALAKHYNKTPDECARALMCRISTLSDRSKSVKKIWINFTDTNTNILVNHAIKF